MPTLLFALIAAALASTGGRDQRLIAALAGRLGKANGLLLTGWLVAALTAGVAAWAGSAMAGLLPPPAKQMLAAIALAVAAAEMLWPRSDREPEEPTRSLGALAIVLAARQIGDGPRFLIFAIAIAGNAPALAAVGGAIGSAAALTLGWSLGDDLARSLPLKALRLAIALLLLVAGAIIAIFARGLVG
jgi:putative Ca2+/H+ antiporter (TMEM165/GDT1 family)